MFDANPTLQDAPLVVDGTGVGRAVVDMFRAAALKTSIRPIVITGGTAVSRGEDGTTHVAKKELVGVLQVLLQARRLLVSDRLPEAKTLVKELQNFRVKITAAANETLEAWREGDHDDLVLAVALACWWAENRWTGPFTVTADPGSRSPFADPPPGVFLS